MSIFKYLFISIFFILFAGADGSAEGKISVAEDYYNKGIAAYKAEDYENAVKFYDKAIEQDSLYADAYIDRGEAKFRLGNTKEAIHDFSRAIELSPENDKYLFVRATVYNIQQNYQLARIDLEKAITINDKKPVFYAALTYVSFVIQDYKSVIENAEKALEMGFDDPDLHNNIAIAQYMNENYKTALKSINTALSGDRNNLDYLYYRGLINMKLKDSSQAFNDFLKAKEAEDPEFLLYYYLGTIYKSRAQIDSAIYFLDKAALLNNTFGAIYSDRGKCYFQLKRYNQAIPDLLFAEKLSPGYYTNTLNLGLSYYFLGKYKKSIVVFDRAIKLTPEDYMPYYHRGLAYMHLKSMNDGESDLEKAVELNPSLMGALKQLADLCIIQKDTEKLENILKKIKLVDTECYNLHFFSGVYCLMTRDAKSAIEDFDKALEIQPENGELYYLLGISYISISDAYIDIACSCFYEALEYGYKKARPVIDKRCYDTAVGRYKEALRKNKNTK